MLTDSSLVLKTLRLISAHTNQHVDGPVSVLNLPVLLRKCASYDVLQFLRIYDDKVYTIPQHSVVWYTPLMIVAEFWVSVGGDMYKIPEYESCFKVDEAKRMVRLLVECHKGNMVTLYDKLYASGMVRENPRVVCFFWDDFWPGYNTEAHRAQVKHRHPVDKALSNWH